MPSSSYSAGVPPPAAGFPPLPLCGAYPSVHRSAVPLVCSKKRSGHRVVRFRPVGPILYTGRIRRCLVRGPHTECNNLTIPCGSTQPDSATHPPSVIYKKGVLVAVVSGVAPFILKGVYSDSQCGIRKVVVNYIDFPCPSPVSKSK